MKHTAQEIADHIGGELRGSGNVTLTSVASLKNAGTDDLSYAEEKFHEEVKTSRAGCVIVSGGEFTGRTIIVTRNPKLAFARAAAWLLEEDKNDVGIHPSAVIAPDARIGKNVKVGPLAVVDSGAVIGEGTVLESGSYVGRNCRVGNDCILYPKVVIYAGVDIGNRVIVHSGAVIGADGFGFVKDGRAHVKFPQVGKVVIEDDVEIGAGSTIDRASVGESRIARGTKIDNLVQVGHSCTIGEDTLLCAQVGLAGSSHIGNRVILAGQAGVAGHNTIGDDVVLTAKSATSHDVPAGKMISGIPAFDNRDWLRSIAAFRRLGEIVRTIRGLERRVNEIEERKSE